MNNAQLRIYELSKELNLENKELLAICDQLNIAVKSYSSKISDSDAERIRLAAEKLISKNGTSKQESDITSHQPKLPETIFQNRLTPLHQQQILEIPKPIILTNRPSNTPKPIPPRVLPRNLPTEDNLRIWQVFLQIEEKIAQARQFCVPFFSHNGFGIRISFEIDVTSATLDGSDENSLVVENFWERVKRARNEEVKLFEITPTGQNWRNSRQLGTIEEVVVNSGIIRVRLERDLAEYIAAGRYQLPATGFLFFEAVGDIQQIQRKKAALTQLKQGRTQNPYLGNFLFDASQARPIQKTVELRPEDLLLSSANPSQKAAVETVLASEDLVLIQGPPGTGKTTVIAEICYQVALRGGRTLITSQANLAVDNALSRLVHNPVIRAVRKGNAERVGEEGQPFLEDRVIGRWLDNTATDCERNRRDYFLWRSTQKN